MPAQVPRGNIYQDGERDGGRETHRPVPHSRQGRKEEQDGVDQLEETGDFRGTERTKLSQGGSPCRLNPFQLIPDRRELTAATTIVSSGTSPRINADRLSNNSRAVKVSRAVVLKLYRKSIVTAKGNSREILRV